MRKTIALCVVLGSLAPGLALRADQTAPDPLAPGLSPNERLSALVDRVKQVGKELDSLEASFTQRQNSAILMEPEVAQGTLSYVAPDQVRWEYLTPRPISVVIRGTEMTTWFRDLERVEVLKVDRYSDQVFKYLGATGSMQTLLQYFYVHMQLPSRIQDPYRLELVPKYKRVAKRLKGMELWIDQERYLPVRLLYTEGDGDVTEYVFSNFKVNSEIPRDRFELHLPEGVETHTSELSRRSP